MTLMWLEVEMEKVTRSWRDGTSIRSRCTLRTRSTSALSNNVHYALVEHEREVARRKAAGEDDDDADAGSAGDDEA